MGSVIGCAVSFWLNLGVGSHGRHGHVLVALLASIDLVRAHHVVHA